MNRLLLPPNVGNSLRGRLLSEASETAGFLYAHCVPTEDGYRLLYRDFDLAQRDAYIVRTADRVELNPIFVAAALKRARINHWTVLLTHTHPWQGSAAASDIDLDGERILLPTIFRRVPGLPHGRLIISHNDYDATLISPTQGGESPIRVSQVGDCLMDFPTLRSRRDLSLAEDSPFDRQIRMFGLAGQRVLSELSVGIVGLGGTGSIVSQQLAHLGVSKFIVLDPDTIERSNLNRLVGAGQEDVGTHKVHAAKRLINTINPDAVVKPIVGSANLNANAKKLTACDFMFICTDSQGSRAVLNQLSYQYYLPAIDLGVIIAVVEKEMRITGRVQMIGAGLSCLQCTNLLDPDAVRRDLMTEFERREDPYIVGSPEPQPAVISINGTVSSLAVSMFLSAVTGLPFRSRYQIYRGENGSVRSITSEPMPDCVICSPRGAVGKGDEWDLPGRRTS